MRILSNRLHVIDAEELIMTPECNTGFFIPVDKQSLFILIFEERLLNFYKVIPIFGPTGKDKSCEVKFKYTGANHSMFPLDSNMAKKFLKQNQHIMGCKKEGKKKSNITSSVTDVIDLDDEISPSKACENRIVDLTEVDPEVIVLDETLSDLNKTLSQLDVTCSSIDEVEIIDLSILNSSKINLNRFKNDVEIVCVKANKKPAIPTVPSSTVTTSISRLKENKRKHNNVDTLSKLSISVNTSGARVVECSPIEKLKKSCKRSTTFSNVIELPKKKKRKLQDVSNTRSTVTSPATKPLTDNVIRYYTQISNHVQQIKKTKERLKNKLKNKKQFNSSTPPIRKQLKRLGKQNPNNQCRKIFEPQQGAIAETSRFNRNLHGVHRNGLRSVVANRCNMKALQKHNLKHQSPKKFDPQRQTIARENTFNPNPHDVNREGLRPVVVDGCNIAIGHGKGTFSVKGIKICVDYFANRGHEHVKVFLPVSRKEYFSEEHLAELNTKCDMVFTPSQCINGVWKTSYDDRFIVQYAFEFGGVIVSTDNYRDLLHENPSWRHTIEKRLLMFTWVDDFLMFPVDPLGKRGPTLEQFLRF